MNHTFQEYLKNPKTLTMEDMDHLHQEIAEEIAMDEDALELYEELVETAIRYADIRSRWTLMSREQKMEADSGRTMTHDSLIVKFNQLARYLRMNGKKASWRDALGYIEDDPYNRKRIGDMGCYIAFVHAICAR